MFPRNNMVTLWKLICQYHGDQIPNLIKLASLALTCPTNTADCERSFSVQNYIKCQRGASISAITCDHLMRVCICGTSMLQMNFENAVKIWLKWNASRPQLLSCFLIYLFFFGGGGGGRGWVWRFSFLFYSILYDSTAFRNGTEQNFKKSKLKQQ